MKVRGVCKDVSVGKRKKMSLASNGNVHGLSVKVPGMRKEKRW